MSFHFSLNYNDLTCETTCLPSIWRLITLNEARELCGYRAMELCRSQRRSHERMLAHIGTSLTGNIPVVVHRENAR